MGRDKGTSVSWPVPIVPSVCLLRQLSEVFFETERGVLGGFQPVSWSIGFFVVVVLLFGVFFVGFVGFFAGSQCEESSL